MSSNLFEIYNLNGLKLPNRIIMAPLTRSRATHGTDAPNALNAHYYSQRATAGLIISEATQISPSGKGYAWTPGIYSEAQKKGWQLITNAVHAAGGRIFAQLWHVGRFSHPSLQLNGETPVAPSAIAAPKGSKTISETGEFIEVRTPRALEIQEIKQIIRDYQRAAQMAIEAGFDGVEIHAANGYLIQQFMADASNQRTDLYGGSISNRLRFAFEVVTAIIDQIGANRTGIRLSPTSSSNGTTDSDPFKLYTQLIRELDHLHLAYVHVIEGITGGSRETLEAFDFHKLRALFRGAWIVNNGYDYQLATEAVSSGYADLVAFGKSFLANPDLVKRFAEHLPLNQPDPSTFYGGNEKGYTDYPFA
jgi:N-ethylmaleimide reductase